MIRAQGFGAAFLLACFLFTYQLGAFPLFDLDEAIYAETAREMVETGDWLTPQFNYAPEYDKPVLLYWLMSAAFLTLGASELAARLPSALFGLMLLIATYGLMRSVRGERGALFSMLILAGCLEMVVLAHAALTDMLLVFFMTAALASYYMLYRTDHGLWSIGLYSALALAVMTKGPVGLVLPGAIILLFMLTVGPWREQLRRIRLGWGILIFMALALPWYGIMFRLHGAEFWTSFFLRHNVERFTSVLGGHAGSSFYYLGVLAVGFFPWIAFLPSSLSELIPGGNWSERWKRFRALPAEKPFEWFLLLWIGVIVVFFTLAGTKLPNYIAPAFPALALLIGGWWERRMEESDSTITRCDRHLFWFLGLLTLIIASALLLAPAGIEWARTRYSTSAPFLFQTIELNRPLMIAAATLMLGTLTFQWFYRFIGRWQSFMVLVLTMGIFVFILLFQLIPSVSGYIQMPLRDLARQANAWVPPDEPMILFGLKKPSVLFYARRGAVIFKANQIESLRDYLKSKPRAVILSSIRWLPLMNTVPNLILREEAGGYVLATFVQ